MATKAAVRKGKARRKREATTSSLQTREARKRWRQWLEFERLAKKLDPIIEGAPDIDVDELLREVRS